MFPVSIARQVAHLALPGWAVYGLRARRRGVDALIDGLPPLPAAQVRRLFRQLQRVTDHVECGHSEDEALQVISAILATPAFVPGVVVEAGCWKGGSSCKFSLAARLANRRFHVFDSFEGIPDVDEGPTRNIHGAAVRFRKGDYAAAIDEVRGNLEAFGDLSVTTLVPGWLEDSLPRFKEPIAVAYLDVDLASSTRTCLKYMWPLLSKGGVIFSQDGHLGNVLDAMTDDAWWQAELGHKAPRVYGAGVRKLVSLVKA